MSFDGIEHITGIFQKIKFYIGYGKMFFFTDSLFTSRGLWIA